MTLRPAPTHSAAESACRDLANDQSERDNRSLPIIVSLFSGAGGLDLGFVEEGFKVGIAFDLSAAAIQTHKRNFPSVHSVCGNLVELGPFGVLRHVLVAVPVGSRIGIIGGPPCQGFSRANTSSTADDPRNSLPALYLQVVRELQKSYVVEFIVFENVLGMRDAKHSRTYRSLVTGLKRQKFTVQEQTLCALDFGVPQTRHRVIISAVAASLKIAQLAPRRRTGPATVREAIGDLPQPTFFSRKLEPDDISAHPNHWTMNPRSTRFLSDNTAGKGRSFKRLCWDKASPTIAFGHREIHVHPSGSRRLSIFEAMLLQGFPRDFVLEGNLSEQVEQISNAVPPPLARSIASAIRRSLAGRVP